MKFEAVNEVVRYEPKVDLNGEFASRDKKYGIAVITTIKDINQLHKSGRTVDYTIPGQQNRASQNKMDPSNVCLDQLGS